jgi:hypothetical protein
VNAIVCVLVKAQDCSSLRAMILRIAGAWFIAGRGAAAIEFQMGWGCGRTPRFGFVWFMSPALGVVVRRLLLLLFF